jgi:type VI secretion system secreted protein VgrG
VCVTEHSPNHELENQMSNLREGVETLLALLGDRQHKRLLRLRFPDDDAPDAVLLANRLDAYEALSRDFMFTVEVISENPRIELKQMQGKNVTVELVRGDGTLRYFNGYVFEFRQVRTDGAYAYYDMVLVPWLAYLRLRRDNYVFHGLTMQQQTEEIFADYKSVCDWETRQLGDDPAMTDACQYNETDYNYLHRRWEALGWHYWYEHRADGHKLVLCGDSAAADPIDGAKPAVRWQAEGGSIEEEGVRAWTPVRRIVPSKVALSSFDFKRPMPSTVEVPTINRQGEVLQLEDYQYEGAYGYKDIGIGDKLVRRRMEEIEASGKHFEAIGNNRFLLPGRWYRLTDHYDAHGAGGEGAGQFLVLEVKHEACNNYLQNAGPPAHYENRFSCIRKTIPWRPGRGYNSMEPRIYGPQTAIVVGPKGEEIFTDQYGRVKVQFHWDRVGTYDEKSSAWVRVASTWAGSNFGFVAVPRIGQEVVVQFLDGNPDRPLITGRLYNEYNMPPWGLPASMTQTGILSRSSQGGGYDNANAIRFEDKKGAEEVWLHAEKDQRIEVENDESHWVGHDRSKTVDNDETVHVKHDRTETVDNDEKITVHNNRTERVDHDEKISVGDNRSEDVGQNETIQIGQNQTVNIGANRSVTVGGNKVETVMQAKAETIALAKALSIGLAYQTTVGAAMNTTVGLSQTTQVAMSKGTKVGKTYSIEAGDELSITVGKATLVMKSDGTISINGHTFNVGTTGEQVFKADGEIVSKGKKILDN